MNTNHPQDKSEFRRIIFEAQSAVGDSIEYIPALYVLRQMYPQAEILVSTYGFGTSLFAQLPFIDRVYDTEHTQEGFWNAAYSFHDEQGNTACADLIIIPDRRGDTIRTALSTDARKIVTFSHLKALFIPRLHFTSYISRWKCHEILHYQHLMHACDHKRYNKVFAQADFSQAKVRYEDQDKRQVQDFLRDANADSYQHLVVVNPHSHTAERCGFNLKVDDYLNLTERLALSFPQCLFVVSSFGTHTYQEHSYQALNLKIFINQRGILSLVALIDHASLVISPSTAAVHIADNLGVDVCAIYPHYDQYRWSGDGMNQLLAKQARKLGRASSHAKNINRFSCIYLPQNWQKNYEQYLIDFEQLCSQFIQTHTLKQPRKLFLSDPQEQALEATNSK